MSIPLISKIKPQNNGAFPMYDDVDAFGGFQVRDDITDRDSIPTLNRKAGMLVYTVGEATYWILGPGLTNSDWSSANFGGGTDPAALAQTTWYFDNVSGSDTNTGLVGSPLKTAAEYIKRVGYTRKIAVGQTVDLYFLSDMVSTDRLSMRVIIDDPTSKFKIHGTPTILLSGSLTNFTAPNYSGNTTSSITAAGLGASHIGKTIRFPDIDGYGVIWKNIGGGTVYLDEPKTYTELDYTDITPVTPSNTENFIIYDNTKLYLGSLDFIAGYPDTFANAWPAKFVIEWITSVDSFTLNGSAGFYQFTTIRNSQLADVVSFGNASTYFRTCYINAGFGGSTALAANSETGVKFTGTVLAGGNIATISPTFGLRRFDSNVIACFFISINYIASQEGKIALFTTSPLDFSGIVMLQGIFTSTHDTDLIYGVCAGNNALTVSRDSEFIYQPGFQLYTQTTSGVQISVRLTGGTPPELSPSIMLSQDGLLPALSPCTTWTQLLASPFNGTAWDYSTQSGFTTDPFNTAAPSISPPPIALGGDLDGNLPAPTVVGIQNNPISPVVPSPADVLTWDGYIWGPAAPGTVTSVTNTTAPYAILSSDYVVTVSSGGTITLEPSPLVGRMIIIKDVDGLSASSNITIDGNGNIIDGQNTLVIAVNYQSVSLIFTGSGQWSTF